MDLTLYFKVKAQKVKLFVIYAHFILYFYEKLVQIMV